MPMASSGSEARSSSSVGTREHQARRSRRRSASAAAAARDRRTAGRSPARRSTWRPRSPSRGPSSTIPSTSAMVTGSRCTRAVLGAGAGEAHERGAAGAHAASSRTLCGEDRAAVGVVAEHVEARARRGEQHRVPGLRGLRGRAHRFRQRSRDARCVHTPASACASCARVAPDEHAWRTLPRKAAASGREVLALAIPAGDHHQRACHAGDRRERRADVGALGVVDVGDAVRRRRPTASGAADR